jgi:hypothetical protein
LEGEGEVIVVRGFSSSEGFYEALILAGGGGIDLSVLTKKELYAAIYGGKEFISYDGNTSIHTENIILIEGGMSLACSGSYQTGNPDTGKVGNKGAYAGLKLGPASFGFGGSGAIIDFIGWLVTGRGSLGYTGLERRLGNEFK